MAFAEEESLTITTYYPSPYGSYRELSAHRMKVGLNYSTQTVTDNNLIVEGQIGVGTTDIRGDTKLTVEQQGRMDYTAIFRGVEPSIFLKSNDKREGQFKVEVSPGTFNGTYLISEKDLLHKRPVYIDASEIVLGRCNVRIGGHIYRGSTTTEMYAAKIGIGALIVSNITTAQRDRLIPENGMIIYNSNTNRFNFYENGAWVTRD